MAPAGSMETLKAVCIAGADAVYVGGTQFGARAYAKNFTEDELLAAIDYVHLHEKKLHLTINTLLKTKELEEQLYDYLLPYYERGLDAVIVQDVGVFSFVRKYFPNIEIHASTQMNITGADGVHFWEQAGADRVVLARELSLQEIRYIHEKTDMELECFAHGALCYCYSGQCLFSSMLGGRSGNRGRCAQPCRLPYAIADREHHLTKGEVYVLSLKDLCTIDLLPELRNAGVASLKIEGRMKQTAYAAGVTGIYRKYLDLLESECDYAVAETDRRMLMEYGNRSGFTAGYLHGEKGKTMLTLQSPKHSSGQMQAAIETNKQDRLVRGTCICQIGCQAQLTVTDILSGKSVTVFGGEIQEAKNAPVSSADVEKILRQTGDTIFSFDTLEIEMDENCFIPKQFLKVMRRDALEKIHTQLLRGLYRKKPDEYKEDRLLSDSLQPTETFDPNRIFAVCDTWEQFCICTQKEYIATVALQLQNYPKEHLFLQLKEANKRCMQMQKKLVLAMPAVLRSEIADFYEKNWKCIKNMYDAHNIAGFLAKNYDTLGFLQRMGIPEEDVWLDSQLYTFSNRASDFFQNKGYRNRTLPLELTAVEMRQHLQENSCLIIYGHAPFMVSSQCVNKTVSGCDHTQKTLDLVDRYGKHFFVKNNCSICCNMIYNAVPTVLYDPTVFDDVRKLAPKLLRIDFTVEDPTQTMSVLAAYEHHVLGRQTDTWPDVGAYTRGHFKHGVE